MKKGFLCKVIWLGFFLGYLKDTGRTDPCWGSLATVVQIIVKEHVWRSCSLYYGYLVLLTWKSPCQCPLFDLIYSRESK